jgi:predicted phosphodiesterase
MEKSETSRTDLDLNYIAGALLRQESFLTIAKRETERLGKRVTRNQIAALKRDIRLNRVDLTGKRYSNPAYDTFVYDMEADNGGVPVFTGHPQRTFDAFMVVSDIHSPYTDFEFADKSIEVARLMGIHNVIIAGDVLHGEQKSGWRSSRGALTRTTTLKQDLDILSNYLWGLVDAGVNQIDIIRGNHDDWLLADWKGDLDFRTFLKMLDSGLQRYIMVSNYDRITVTDITGEVWTIPHQKDYSPTPGVVGNELVNKFRTNVIIPHQHLSGMTLSRYGQNVIIDIGGLHSPEKTAYIGLKTSKGAVPKQGFATVNDKGVAQLWTPDRRLTDWSILERD